MKVSIVLPSFNYARYLDERITSLLGQTFGDFELIVVDDASTDDSRAVIGKYSADPRIRTLWFETNSGQLYQRWNDGAALATGEYLLFAGADDSCAPTFLETLVGILDAHPDVGIAHSRSWVIDAGGKRTALKPRRQRWAADFVVTGAEEAPFMLTTITVPTASAALLRRSVFEQCGGFDTSFRLAADHMLWARMLHVSGIAYVAEPLNYFRDHDQVARRRYSRNSLVLERYRVAKFMTGAFDIPAAVREHTFDWLARRWLKQIVKNRSLADFDLDRRMYRVARDVDPAIDSRLLRAAYALLSELSSDRLGHAVAWLTGRRLSEGD